jgi:plastocyanin
MPRYLLFTTFPLIALLSLRAGPVARTYADEVPDQNTKTIEITDFKFDPKEIAISPGTKVTWVNHDDVPHTATADGDSPAFDSKALDTDEKYSFTFKNAGTFPYHCKVHPHMTGTVTVK